MLQITLLRAPPSQRYTHWQCLYRSCRLFSHWTLAPVTKVTADLSLHAAPIIETWHGMSNLYCTGGLVIYHYPKRLRLVTLVDLANFFCYEMLTEICSRHGAMRCVGFDPPPTLINEPFLSYDDPVTSDHLSTKDTSSCNQLFPELYWMMTTRELESTS